MAKRRSALIQPVDPLDPADLTIDAIGAECRHLWAVMDGKLDSRIKRRGGKPGQTLLSALLVLERLKDKARATLLELGMTLEQLGEFERINEPTRGRTVAPVPRIVVATH